jgi:hypothetical protein
MAKLGIFASIITIVATLGFATLSPADASDPCHRTAFKTVMVKEACAKGGEAQAKTVMKKFMKEKKIKSCNKCHSKLAPTYDLKPDGLKQFQDLGGK